ncbi:hypothetical protein ACFMPD_13300 [Sedimentitalea sp. HM32M-2]|uniref:hypothetical protein n=1 Tax=Sedimentitalea sp. HM32M-2 TaxID=3351566 RepID=UPI00363691F0
MVQAKITSEESAQKWLETQPYQVRVWFAARCVLRALPKLGALPENSFDSLTPVFFRALLTITAATTDSASGTDKETAVDDYSSWRAATALYSASGAIGNAENENENTAMGLGRSAHFTLEMLGAAGEPALQFYLATERANRVPYSKTPHPPCDMSLFPSAYGASFAAAEHDAVSPGDWSPLWPNDTMPPGLAKLWDRMKRAMQAAPEKWGFWLEWYEAILYGRPLPWALSQRIAASVTEAEWDAGPKVVAARIEEIKATFLRDKAPLAETVELNVETGKFRVDPIPIENPALLGAMIARADDAIEDALLGQNGLRQDSHEIRVLRRANTQYANDPQRIEMDYTSVAASLRRQIGDTHELAESEDNLALLEAVQEGALAIRAQHPDVANNRNIIATQKMRELGPEGAELLEDALPLLTNLSESTMQQDFAQDIPALINDATQPLISGAPPLPGADEATRIFNRAAKMKLRFDQACETGARIFDSREFKTARLGLTVSGLLSALVSLGLWLFGVL